MFRFPTPSLSWKWVSRSGQKKEKKEGLVTKSAWKHACLSLANVLLIRLVKGSDVHLKKMKPWSKNANLVKNYTFFYFSKKLGQPGDGKQK